MPNWAFVDYQIVGDEQQLDSLYLAMKELEEREEPLLENGFGKTWLGNLVAKLGGDVSKVSCRGSWNLLSRNADGIFISMETAWGEPNEVREFIEEKFPGLKIYFQSTSDDFWQTNDKEGLFFADRYVLYTDENGEDYYRDLSEVIAEVEAVTGCSGLQTFEDCEEALERHCEVNGSDAYLYEFDILD